MASLTGSCGMNVFSTCWRFALRAAIISCLRISTCRALFAFISAVTSPDIALSCSTKSSIARFIASSKTRKDSIISGVTSPVLPTTCSRRLISWLMRSALSSISLRALERRSNSPLDIPPSTALNSGARPKGDSPVGLGEACFSAAGLCIPPKIPPERRVAIRSSVVRCRCKSGRSASSALCNAVCASTPAPKPAAPPAA